jgi:hypothetical protein
LVDIHGDWPFVKLLEKFTNIAEIKKPARSGLFYK